MSSEVGGGALVHLPNVVVDGAVAMVRMVVYVGNEIAEAMKDGSIVCKGDSFEFRTKTRGAFYWASSLSTLLPPSEASKILNREVAKCDPNTAFELRKKIIENRKLHEKKVELAQKELDSARKNLDNPLKQASPSTARQHSSSVSL